MNAKEWLIEQGFSENTAYLDCVNKEGFGYPLEILMERYTNYKTKDLQSKILGFRQILEQRRKELNYVGFVKQYDEHFNITAERNGTTK